MFDHLDWVNEYIPAAVATACVVLATAACAVTVIVMVTMND